MLQHLGHVHDLNCRWQPEAFACGCTLLLRCNDAHTWLYLAMSAVLGTMLRHCAFHRPSLLKATAGLMACAVEKESKCEVMRQAGRALVHMLQVGDALNSCV